MSCEPLLSTLHAGAIVPVPRLLTPLTVVQSLFQSVIAPGSEGLVASATAGLFV